jgi:transcriptional regulator with XRE-family HTH domain
MPRTRAGAQRLAPFVEEPPTFGEAIRLIRTMEGVSLEEFSTRLGIPRRNLQEVEKDRRGVSVKRAVEWARLLRYPENVLVRLALQRKVTEAGSTLKVRVDG